MWVAVIAAGVWYLVARASLKPISANFWWSSAVYRELPLPVRGRASLVIWAVVATFIEPVSYVVEVLVMLNHPFQDVQLGQWNVVAFSDLPLPTVLVAMYCRHATLSLLSFIYDDEAEQVWRPISFAELLCVREEMLEHAKMMIKDVLYV